MNHLRLNYNYHNFSDDIFKISKHFDEMELQSTLQAFFFRLTLAANYIFKCKFECLEEFRNKNLNDLISFINKNFKLEDYIKVGLTKNLKSCYNDTVRSALIFLDYKVRFNRPISDDFFENNPCLDLENFIDNSKENSAVIYRGFKNYFNETYRTFAETKTATCQNKLYSIPNSIRDCATEVLEPVEEKFFFGENSLYLTLILFVASFIILIIFIIYKFTIKKYNRIRRNQNIFELS